jgi:hypothetical protein
VKEVFKAINGSVMLEKLQLSEKVTVTQQ